MRKLTRRERLRLERQELRESMTKERRRLAQERHRRRQELTEQILLGLDDTSPDAPFEGELNFDKYMDMLDLNESYDVEADEEKRRREEEVLTERRRIRKGQAHSKIQWG